MITVAQAEKIISAAARPFPAVSCRLEKAAGRILRENIVADRDHPAADRSSMDGIAVAFKQWQKGTWRFKRTGVQKAGIPALSLKRGAVCAEIMTGGLMPRGADSVIPVEDILWEKNIATVRSRVVVKHGQYVRRRGQDYRRGKVLLKKGARLTPPHVAIAAAAGRPVLKVAATPRVAVIGTGDELVAVSGRINPHQVRPSNAYAVRAALLARGFDRVTCYQLRDRESEILRRLRIILKAHDVIVLSGGVSMGKLDLIPGALAKMKVRVLFHKVMQKPGKPFWFGVTGDKKAIFALPGNPVSTQVCACRYVIPFLEKASGSVERPVYIRLARAFALKEKKTFFLPVTVQGNAKGQRRAVPADFRMSGNFSALAGTDGFVELPKGPRVYKAGFAARFFSWS